MRDFYLILNSLVALSLFGLGIVAFINDKRNVMSRFFLLFTICVGVWLVSACVSNDIRNNSEVSLYGNYAVFMFSYFSSYLLLWFAASIARADYAKKWLMRVTLPLILVGFLSATPLVVGGVEVQGQVYAVNFGPLTLIYALTLLGLLASSIVILRRGLKLQDSKRRAQIKTLYICLVVSIPILLVTQFIAPVVTGSFEVTDTGILIMVLPVIGLYISAIQHGLFDIKRAAIRSLAYILILTALAGIYYFMAYAISETFLRGADIDETISLAGIVFALVLAFIFQPIKRFFDQLTDSIFYRDMYKTDEFFARISELLGSTTDLRGLLERTSVEIATTLKAEQAFFFLYYTNVTRRHLSAGTAHHNKLPVYDAHDLDAYVMSSEEGIIVTDLLPETSNVRRMLVSHKIALVMPLKYSGTLLGYVLLGEQQRSGGYNKRDLKVLSTITDSLVIGVQNALSIHAVKEVNLHLQQRIDVATKELRSSNSQLRHLDEVKDEFMSMASHQLRTPLTSIKGYLSMVLEEDMGKITSQQRTVLSEAFNSSERMVRLIADFLNVSRLQTGKFIIEKSPVNIVNVVRSEVNSLQMIATTHDMKLVFTTKEKDITLPIDEAKVRQVVMNFIDNAIYYSPAKSTISVLLETIDDQVAFKVVDSGIGVPASEQPLLFNKFFRAKNARQQRPDGTGVGLYLAKKVIVAHGGKMIFSSVEGKGSTFGFRLPLPDPDLQAGSKANHLKNKHHNNT